MRSLAILLIVSLIVALVVSAVGCGGEVETPAPTPTPTPIPTSSPTPSPVASGTELLWDTWGVPHIFAQDDDGLAYALGWAQMKSHGDLILRLYAQASGRAAEYFGEEFLESDRYVRTVGIPERAIEWYGMQSEDSRSVLDAFAAGLNDFATLHADTIGDEVKVVLPVSGVDVIAHVHRVLNFVFVAGGVQGDIELWRTTPGSNGWAIAPGHSATGNAMLLGNPHLPWSEWGLFYEAQFNTPDYDFYGATLVGFPMPALGFNDYLGWTATVNTYDGFDLYELELADNGYMYDGELREFDTEEQIILVRQEDGSSREEQLTIRRAIQGPVVAEKEGQALALRVAGLDRPGVLEQWRDMLRATDLEEFESALSRLQMPMFNIIYADREGNIMQLFNGLVPVRSQGDYYDWAAVMPGDTSETLWTEYHSYEDLPRVVNPESGWLQNANEPPWYMTIPYPLSPEDFPAYMAPPGMDIPFRTQRSQRMLLEDDSITFDEMVTYKFSAHSELADRILDELVSAARESDSELVNQAADVLESWDHAYNADSQGPPLFFLWMLNLAGAYQTGSQDLLSLYDASIASGSIGELLFAVPWDNEAEPLTVPDGLADPAVAVKALETAAAQLMLTGSPLDLAWGDIVRMRVGEYDLPASGGPDAFRVLIPQPMLDGTFQIVHGDSFMFAVEFSDPIQASALTVYGSATQAGSPHVGDQLELYARNEMRPVWRTLEEIEAHLESREVFE